MTLSPVLRRTWANIDLDAVRHNFSLIRAQVGDKKKICCVIKANAYGHGAAVLAREYEALGADFFAVSNLEEALQLRRAGIKLPVLILGYTDPACAPVLAEADISQCVFSERFAEALSAQAEKAGVRVKIHIKIDSGMGRIGFAVKDGDRAELDAAERACRLPALETEGIFTHFASADEGEGGEEYTRAQFRNFLHACDTLEERGIAFAVRHCANSAAIFEYPEMHLDMVRAGVILYGLQPSGALRCPAPLRPVMTLESVVSHVKQMKAGESVSYGRTFTAEKDLTVATVPVGYADGLWRCNSPAGMRMTLAGGTAPVVGRICMDQCMLDVSELPGVKEGDRVTVYGADRENGLDAAAARCGTINYELACAVGMRVPRVYRRDGEIVEISDALLD